MKDSREPPPRRRSLLAVPEPAIIPSFRLVLPWFETFVAALFSIAVSRSRKSICSSISTSSLGHYPLSCSRGTSLDGNCIHALLLLAFKQYDCSASKCSPGRSFPFSSHRRMARRNNVTTAAGCRLGTMPPRLRRLDDVMPARAVPPLPLTKSRPTALLQKGERFPPATVGSSCSALSSGERITGLGVSCDGNTGACGRCLFFGGERVVAARLLCWASSIPTRCWSPCRRCR